MPTRTHGTILVVEDDRNDQVFIVSAFRSNGVQDPIHVVNSAAEAIAYLLGQGKFADRTTYEYPAMLLTDLKMSGGDGFAVLEYLKRNPERSIVPTVVLSASVDPDDVKRSYLLGASCYHQKPVSHHALRHQLKVLHEYWMTCLVPPVDRTGRQIQTSSHGKLGQRFGGPPERR